MELQHVSYSVSDGVATVTLDRPDKLNAFTPRMMWELLDVLDRTDSDDDVRAVIVTGSGRAFCAGADLSAGGDTFSKGGSEIETPQGVRRDGGGMVSLRIFESLKPVIAAVNGAAVGVGATMTLPMDVRLASESARFGFVFSRRGIIPEACSSWFLPRVVGISRAAEWVYTGRIFGADEALEAGLVRSVHPDAELLAAATALAREIADHTSPVSVALSRRMLWRMMGASHPMEAHRVDSRGIDSRGKSADVREGVTSFLEKRPAVFPDRVSDGIPDLFPGGASPGSSDAPRTTMTASDDRTLHDIVGSDFFVRLVDAFYDGVEHDAVLMALYPDGSDTLAARRRLAMFLVQYFGGPTDYMDERGHPRLRMRHNQWAIGSLERDRWLVHMAVAIETTTADLDGSVRDRVVDELANYVVNAAEHLRNT